MVVDVWGEGAARGAADAGLTAAEIIVKRCGDGDRGPLPACSAMEAKQSGWVESVGWPGSGTQSHKGSRAGA